VGLAEAAEHLGEHATQLAERRGPFGLRPELLAHAGPIDPSHRGVVVGIPHSAPRRVERHECGLGGDGLRVAVEGLREGSAWRGEGRPDEGEQGDRWEAHRVEVC
jgi:hypothetical protein